MESIIYYTLKGNIPSKKNSRITSRKTGRSFPSKNYTAWHKEAVKQIKSQINHDTLDKVQHIQINLIFPTKRKSDLTNKAESVMDLLVDCGVLLDDNWYVVPEVILKGSYQKNDGGANVVILLEKPG